MEKALAREILGPINPCIAWSKSEYCKNHKKDLVVFNANVCINEPEMKLWYGDLNVTEFSDKLQDLANKINKKVYVLNEQDAKWIFGTEEHPNFKNPEKVFMPDKEAK